MGKSPFCIKAYRVCWRNGVGRTPGRKQASIPSDHGDIGLGIDMPADPRLKRVFLLKYRQARFYNDPHIKPDRPVFDVIQIVLGPLLDLLGSQRLAPPAIDLGPPS